MKGFPCTFKSSLPGLRRMKGGMNGGARGIFKAVKLLCMFLQRWIRVIVHLPQPRGRTTAGANPTINYKS